MCLHQRNTQICHCHLQQSETEQIQNVLQDHYIPMQDIFIMAPLEVPIIQ